MANIGSPLREIEVIPLESEPVVEPVEEPVPATPVTPDRELEPA